MRLEVALFAVARQRAGRSSLVLDLSEPATVADVKRALGDACPALAPLLPQVRIAVDAEYADDDQAVAPGAEVAVIPPVSGGSSSLDRLFPGFFPIRHD